MGMRPGVLNRSKPFVPFKAGCKSSAGRSGRRCSSSPRAGLLDQLLPPWGGGAGALRERPLYRPSERVPTGPFQVSPMGL